MAKKRGISVLDLIGLPPGSNMIIPNWLTGQLENLAVLEYTAIPSGDVYVYRGTVQSIADAWLPGLKNWPVEAPMLNTGLQFQMIRRRAAMAAGNTVEPAIAGWQIDFFLDRVAITIPGLRPAQRVEASGTIPAHLVPDTKKQSVRIVGGGTLRLTGQAGLPAIAFVNTSDPIDPDAPSGAVYNLSFDPPHFFIGKSDVGMTVDRLVYDDSQTYTPDEIVARGHGADWQGLSIREATVYMPRNAPVIGDLNAGVRDVLLGNPAGIQGEVQVEFGVADNAPSTLVWKQRDESDNEILIAPDPQTKNLIKYVRLPGTEIGQIKVEAGGQYAFTLPDGTSTTGTSVGYFDVHEGDSIVVQTLEIDDQNQQAVGQPYPYYFKEGPPYERATIGISFPGKGIFFNGQNILEHVTYVSGKLDDLQGIKFHASAVNGLDATKHEWKFGAGIGADTGTGPEFQAPIPPTLGKMDLVLTDEQKRTRRLRLDMIESGPIIIGCADGVFTIVGDHSEPVKSLSVEGTYESSSFDAEGYLFAKSESAEVNAAGEVVAPEASIVGVTVQMGAPGLGPYEDPPNAPPASPKRHLQVLMEFNTPDEYNWGMEGLPVPFSIDAVQNWAKQFGDAAEFVVIGRTCDIGSDDYNAELARIRAARGASMLEPIAGSIGQVYQRGEFDNWNGNLNAQTAQSNIQPGLSTEEQQGHLIESEHPELTGQGDKYVPPRMLYRRVDIYAIGGAQPPQDQSVADYKDIVGPSLRRSLVPGADLTQVNIPPAPAIKTPYRVRLRVKWDSPTVVSLDDAIPTLAEVLVTWQGSPSVDLPSAGSTAITGPDHYTLLGRWTYDSRSGATLFSLAFNNDEKPDGLFSATNTTLATAMLLAPALLSGITSDSPSGVAARLTALLGASVAAAKFAKPEQSKVIVHGIEIQEQQRALGQFGDATHRVLFDYTAQIGVDIDAAAVKISTNNPLKVRYENCGLEYDGAKTGADAINLVYDEAKFDVADPGEWVIDGPLGKLLRVAGTRAGSGSTWFEIDLEFALDLGVIKITSATIRVTFPTGQNEFGFELRGLGVEVNIPGTLTGSGRMVIGAGGAFKSDIKAKIIPAGIEARASLVMDAELKYLEVGVVLPAGIPLASTGLGIFGFIGRFVVNGKRLMPDGADPVEQEIAWYRAMPSSKYTGAEGQFALGLGIIVGTLPDTAFSFNAVGMLTVAFPTPEVVISLDAKLMTKASTEASEQGTENVDQSVEMLGIVAVNEQEFILAIRGHYNIPKILDLKIPISGYFPIKSNNPYYFRIGCDGKEGRAGDPVTATLLPKVLDFTCWLYLMMEEKGLVNLGDAKQYGLTRIDLTGFSVGFGAGFDLDWSADPFSLSARGAFLLGLGTKPLTLCGGIAVEGELDLVLVTATVGALLEGRLQRINNNTSYWLHGAVHAEVDLGIGSVGGSIDITVSDGPAVKVPKPEHPLVRVDLTDRRGAKTGSALLPGEQGTNVVWPDTTPVIHFSSYIENKMSGGAFTPGKQLPGPNWVGSSDLKYAYQLNSVKLFKNGVEVPGPLDSVWWWPTHKGGLIDPNGPEPSDQEGRSLALLSWKPAPVLNNLVNGGADSPADPSKTLGQVCTPPILPGRNIALGLTADKWALGKVNLYPEGLGEGPLPCWFQINGTETGLGKSYSNLIDLMNAQGKTVMPGAVVSFAAIGVAGEKKPFTAGYELPYIAYQNYFEQALQFDGLLAGPITAAALTLAVWNKSDKQKVGTTLCDTFSDVRPGTTLPYPWTHNGWRYESASIPPQAVRAVDMYPAGAPDGKTEITGTGGVLVTLNSTVDSVTVEIVQFGVTSVTVRAYNSSGGLIAQAVSGVNSGVPQKVTVNAAGIFKISVMLTTTGTRGDDFVIRQICTTTYKETSSSGSGAPVVIGTDKSNVQTTWTAQLVSTVPGPGVGTLQVYRYVPSASKTWKSFKIAEYKDAHLLVLGLSGVDAAKQDLADQNEEVKDDIKDNLGDQLDNPDATEKRALLEPGATYSIEVSCSWIGWKKEENQPTPPDADDPNAAWEKFDTQTFTFQVANLELPVTDTTPPPADLQTESLFDPRGLKRYLIGIEPDGGFPHFLKDPMISRFEIDYIDQLLALYGRKLVFKLRRTDPPCGSLAVNGIEFSKPPDVDISVEFDGLDEQYIPDADKWWIDYSEIAPCIEGTGSAGKQAQITADLVPDAEYDLLLVAAPLNNLNSDQVLIARSHFHTSRYDKPLDMLAAAGFKSTANPVLPYDLFLPAQFAEPVKNAQTMLENDRELEQTLRDLGFDPLPVPSSPRTSIVWKQSGNAYQIKGVLVDMDEASYRGARMKPNAMRIKRVGQPTVTFDLRRSNASGTRLLFWLDSALQPVDGDTIEFELKDKQATISGSRIASKKPRAVYEEED